MDLVAQDKGMLGLSGSVNGQAMVDARDTNWSQWRYVVNAWFFESGTSMAVFSLSGKLGS